MSDSTNSVRLTERTRGSQSLLVGVIVLLVSACGGGSGGTAVVETPPPPSISTTGADISLLFMGNSHTTNNNVPDMVAAMVRLGKPGKTVAAKEAPNWMFLEERANDVASLTLLRSQRWHYVILQAQAISASGQFFYPTTGAEQLVRLSRQVGALPILFPEWPRLNIAESKTIYDKYVSIAVKEPSCVPPIPQAFDLARARQPLIILHDNDGNHSAPAGAFLAALVLYATITGLSPADLPAVIDFNVDADVQGRLRLIAAETVQTIAPRFWCAADQAV